MSPVYTSLLAPVIRHLDHLFCLPVIQQYLLLIPIWRQLSLNQLWDAEQGAITGRAMTLPALGEVEERIWDELQRFSFGTPDLLLLDDGTVLLTYYATRQAVIHVRACGFRVRE